MTIITLKMIKSKSKFTTVSIPVQLAKKIEQRIKKTGFTSLSDYVTYVLRAVILNVEKDEKKSAFSKEDEDKVKERLKGLGYLD